MSQQALWGHASKPDQSLLGGKLVFDDADNVRNKATMHQVRELFKAAAL
jgi:hypothetical protein